MMKRMHLGLAVAVTGLFLAPWAALAQEPKTTGERIKEKASGAVNALKKGVANAEEGIKDQYNRASGAVHSMGVENRVYSRLHWDKALNASKIESSVKDGVVTLRGTVPDIKAKAKAVELAADTVGVTKVVDNLTVLASTTPAPAAP